MGTFFPSEKLYNICVRFGWLLTLTHLIASCGHNILMIGPPGAGKTLLARALPGILPAMSIDEALDVTRIYSVADQLPPEIPLIRQRPFRSPAIRDVFREVRYPASSDDSRPCTAD